MSELVRFTVSLEADLLARFDRHCADGRLATRSEAIRQLLREKLTAAAWEADAADVTASLTLVYDHHKTRLTDKMLDIQHAHADRVVCTTHVHLDRDLCLEMIALRGPAREVQALAAELGGLKGVHQAQLVVVRAVAAAAGGNDHPAHGHAHPHR